MATINTNVDIQITNLNGHRFSVGIGRMGNRGWETDWLDITNGELDIYLDYDKELLMVKEVGADFEYNLNRGYRCIFDSSRIPMCNAVLSAGTNTMVINLFPCDILNPL